MKIASICVAGCMTLTTGGFSAMVRNASLSLEEKSAMNVMAAREGARKGIEVYFQAHRGGLREVPEHTLETYRYAWSLGGLPEADIVTTQDDIVICLHDKTLARTTNAPDTIKDTDVAELTFAQIRQWDAGVYFGRRFAGQKVPSLAEVFQELKAHPERQLYLDLKKLDLINLGALIEKYGVGRQILFAHNRQENLIRFGQIAPEVRTMLWIGGTPEEIRGKFQAALDSGFEGLNQVQLHLHNKPAEQRIEYLLGEVFLRDALELTQKAGIDLEVLPFEFDDASLYRLLDLGIRWYATNYPKRFRDSVNRWMVAE